jgi:pyrimidine operon attenuation protein/uracil phosphoribosyltransferase
MTDKTIFEADGIRRSLQRIAHEILEKNPGSTPLCFIGIHTRGIPLAQRLCQLIREIDPDRPLKNKVGELDISFHRDDLEHNTPIPRGTEVPFDIDGTCVILVDDVFFTGRTIRAAMNALNDLGRPRTIRLAVLVDRGHRQLPIRADYVGKNLPTTFGDNVVCRLSEIDGEDAVRLEPQPEGEISP